MYDRVPIEPGMTPRVSDVGFDRTLAGDPKLLAVMDFPLREVVVAVGALHLMSRSRRT